MRIDDFLAVEGPLDTADLEHFSGPYGLQGGLAAALLLRRMRAVVAPDREPVQLGVRFIRPLRGAVDVQTEPVKSGALVSWLNATATTDGKVGVQAHAAFSTEQTSVTPVLAPVLPDPIAAWQDGPEVPVPPEFGPVAQLIEVRPAMYQAPYCGHDTPVLCAWLRLKDEVVSPAERLVILADSLAPSYAAILTELKAIPTVEMSIQLSAAAFHTEFDWVVARSETTLADARGWVREIIDVWSEDGTHLATASQLRICR